MVQYGLGGVEMPIRGAIGGAVVRRLLCAASAVISAVLLGLVSAPDRAMAVSNRASLPQAWAKMVPGPNIFRAMSRGEQEV